MLDTVRSDVVAAVVAGLVPDVAWSHGDDLCDCTFQRIGMWTNPYTAETLEVRNCCIWAEIYKMFPQFVREVPAYKDENNADAWVTEPQPWNGEADMPVALWHRQLAKLVGVSLADARAMSLEAPKGQANEPKPLVYLAAGGEWYPVELGA